MRKLHLILLGTLMISACTINHGDFTVLSNKIVDTSNFDLENTPRLRNVEGEDITHMIIIFPTGIPKITGALNDAFSKTDTDVMTNVNLSQTSWYIPYIYGQQGWTVKGDAVKTRKN